MEPIKKLGYIGQTSKVNRMQSIKPIRIEAVDPDALFDMGDEDSAPMSLNEVKGEIEKYSI